jgi:hypothetical protein
MPYNKHELKRRERAGYASIFCGPAPTEKQAADFRKKLHQKTKKAKFALTR